MKLRSSFYLAHYLMCRGGEFGSLIFYPQLDFTSSLHDASLLMHPKPCQASKFPVAWKLTTIQWWLGLPLKPWFPFDSPSWLDSLRYFSLRKYLSLIHISLPLESNHLKGLAPKKVLQNNIAQKKISILGSWFMTHDPIVWYQWRYQLRIYYGGSQNHEASMTWAKLSTSMCTKW